MTEEGSCWETNDLALLQSTFEKYTDLMNELATALEYIPMQTGETIEAYFENKMD